MRTRRFLSFLPIGLLAACLAATSSAQKPRAPVTIRIVPGAVSLAPGAQLRFQSVLSGRRRVRVVWEVFGPRGRGVGCGAIDETGLYRAPRGVGRGRFKVVATAVGRFGRPLARDSATVDIDVAPAAPEARGVFMYVDPFQVTVAPGGVIRLWARVPEANKPHVTWSVHGRGGDPRGWGHVNEKGVYFAPEHPLEQPVIIRATLLNRRGRPIGSARCRVHVSPLPSERRFELRVDPHAVAVACGQSVRLTARVAGGNDLRLEWHLSGSGPTDPDLGRIDDAGVYHAPISPPGCEVFAVVRAIGPYGDVLGTGRCAITLLAPVQAPHPAAVFLELFPQPVKVRCGESVQLRARAAGGRSPRLLWEVHGSGKGRRLGRITPDGRYHAPARVPRGRLFAVVTLLGPWGEPRATASSPIEVLPAAPPPVKVAFQPAPVKVPFGGRVRLRPRVQAPPGCDLVWRVEAGSRVRRTGRIDAQGIYQAPRRRPRGPLNIVLRVVDQRGRVRGEARAPVVFLGEQAAAPRPKPGPPTGHPPRPQPKPRPPRARADFGDAPDDSRGPVEAYPGVGGHFPTFKGSRYGGGASVAHCGEEMLGRGVSAEADADGTADEDRRPNHVDRDADDSRAVVRRDKRGRWYIELEVTVAPGAPAMRRFLNVVIDLNRDGAWRDGVFRSRRRGAGPRGVELREWAVRNSPVDVPPGKTLRVRTQPFDLPALLMQEHAHDTRAPWARIVLSRKPLKSRGWTGPGSFGYGEIEDLRLGGSKSPFGDTSPGREREGRRGRRGR